MEPTPKTFRDKALGRIREYEAFLESCGITPMAGSELEFHFTPQASPHFRKIRHIEEFQASPLVEELKTESTMTNVGEVVIGKGPAGRLWEHPGERYPSTVARATESAKKIVGQGDKYGMNITFGERPGIRRIRSLQNNISLWKTADKTPLFQARLVDKVFYNMPSEFTLTCAESVLEVQKAMSALVSPDQPSFDRYAAKGADFGVAQGKGDKQTLAIRHSDINAAPYRNPANLVPGVKPRRLPASHYLEDRLASSEAEPALAMLVTLGGVVEGVKKYMCGKGLVDEHNKPDPAKMKEHIHSPDFAPPISPTAVWDMPDNFVTSVPRNHSTALQRLQESGLARQVMGDDFHKAFCTFYEGLAKGVSR